MGLALFVNPVSPTRAAVIAGNWCNTANIYDAPAGLLESLIWSKLTAPAPPIGNNFYAVDSASGLGGSEAGDNQDVLVYSDGTPAPAGLTISWSAKDLDTNDHVTRPLWPNTTGADIDDGHDQLMQVTSRSPTLTCLDLFHLGF